MNVFQKIDCHARLVRSQRIISYEIIHLDSLAVSCYIFFMKSTWQIQEAKNRLSEVIDLAWTSGRQTITKRSKPTAVILSIRDFLALVRPKTSLVDFFLHSPLHGTELDLERVKDYPRKQVL
mgnify:CR=1 FL=1